MSKLKFSSCWRYGKGLGSCGKLSTMNGSRAATVTTHGKMVVPRFFAVNGPRGTYSHFWISLALQSFMTVNPKILLRLSVTLTRSPSCVSGPPMKKAISNSKSNNRHGPKTGSAPSTGRVCPNGRRMGVPETTTELARP
uniref:Uncharacterized protein n=1 Tax=Lutzomyia longipalpis TaxID=7200 RepID=A0A7G3B3U7_LUTLO